AAAARWHGRPRGEVLRLLTLEDRDGLRLEERSIAWQGIELSAAAIGAARRDFALAIGSCSFTEPVQEIEALGAHLAEA
ncbi:MAG TPA: hypothetical protein VNH46_03530, partial [Gemmatimonadales bacterium]|nr:hypothetical protein [Gemmatimonadales bacterium]